MKLTDVTEWMKSGMYLPECLRDFHDQKDIFKAIHQTINVEGHDYCKDVSWVSGQCYVIDIFLWYMAKRGYTLQRTHKKGDFRNLYEDVKAQRDHRNNTLLQSMLYQKEGNKENTPVASVSPHKTASEVLGDG